VGIELVDWRRLVSIRPEAGPGEDSRDGSLKPGEIERTEPSSERVPGEGEYERPAGEVDLDVGLETGLPTWGSDLLRPRGPKIDVSSSRKEGQSLTDWLVGSDCRLDCSFLAQNCLVARQEQAQY
jgi:hypothetical protein